MIFQLLLTLLKKMKKMLNENKKHWALVLSGGGAKGLAHIGFLIGFEEAGFPKPSLVAGTSMGAIVGGLYACGMSALELEHFILEDFVVTDYLDSFAFKVNGPFGKVIQTGQALASLAGRPGVDSGQRALELLEKLTKGKSFEETEIPFRCNAVDLISGQEIIFSTGSVAKAIRASMSVPLFFEPFIYEGMCLVDGGLLDNMPVAIARHEGYKQVLALNVINFTPSSLENVKYGPQVIFRSLECALNAQGREKKTPADLTINVKVEPSVFSFFKQKELIELGKMEFHKNLNALEVFFDAHTKADHE